MTDHPFVPMAAYNLMPGATFTMPDDDSCVWIAVHVARDCNRERVHVWARRGDVIVETPGASVDNRSFDLDFMTGVGLIGLVVHPSDPDDNDWGSVS